MPRTNRPPHVRTIRFEDGERYSLLVNESGLPIWSPTLFLTTQFRNAARAPNTTRSAAYAIRRLYLWASAAGQEVEQFSWPSERAAEALVDNLIGFLEGANEVGASKPEQSRPVISFERALSRSKKRARRLSGGTLYTNLTYIASYLAWLAESLSEDQERCSFFAKRLLTRRPRFSRSMKMRGWSEEERERIWAAIAANGAKNPFRPTIRLRNEIIVTLLYDLGLRSGELLGLRVSDVDFRRGELTIRRRHNDSSDPRINQPVVKTLSRTLPLTAETLSLLEDYVLKDRAKFKEARKHGILFVSHSKANCGLPLSISGLKKIMRVLGIAVGPLSRPITAHEFRHDSNDRFSILMDREKVPAALEVKLRSYKYGWKEQSGTAAVYTVRHTRRLAGQASLKLQARKVKDNG